MGRQVGLSDTVAAAKAAGFPYIGIGVNADAAWAPYVTTINGTYIAVVGVSQVAELASSWVATGTRPGEANAIDLARTLAAVRVVKQLAKIVIVFMHWGTEGESCPDASQLALAPQLAAAGADIIVGSHAHELQGLGLAWPHVRGLRLGQLPLVGELLQHRHRSAGTEPALERATD